MDLSAAARDLLESAQQPFSIIEEYAALSTKRKVLLCDSLFIEGKGRFRNMVKLLWPEAESHDMKKLEKFLILVKSSL